MQEFRRNFEFLSKLLKESDRSITILWDFSRIPLPSAPLTILQPEELKDNKEIAILNFTFIYCTAFHLCLRKAAGFACCVLYVCISAIGCIGSLHVAKNTELDILMEQI